jgi:hypothetical protein
MNQTYDPMRYVDQTGAGVAQIGSQIAGTLGQFFQENAQWKQFKGNQKSDDEAKRNVYETTLSLLKEKGIDPSGFNIPNPSDKRISPEDYTAKLAESVQSAFVGSGAKLDQGAASQMGISQQPGVKEAIGQQSFLDKNDAMRQIDLNGMAGTPAPAGVPVSDSTEQVDPMLADIAGIGATKPQPEEFDIDPFMKALSDQVRSRDISAKEAFKEVREYEKDRRKERLEDKKADREEKKRMNEDAATGVFSAHRAGFPVTGKDGTEGLNAMDVQQNPGNYTIGNDNPYKRSEWSSGGTGGRGGAGKKETVKDIDTRINMITNDTKQMTDRDGFPLDGFDQQYKMNQKQLKAALVAKNFIQNAGGEKGLSADEAIQEVSGLQSMKDALEEYVPIVPIMENARNRKPEEVLQEGAKYFNQLPKDVYEKLRLSLEAGESPRSILEKLKRMGI